MHRGTKHEIEIPGISGMAVADVRCGTLHDSRIGVIPVF